MALSNRENIIRFFKHQPTEGIPDIIGGMKRIVPKGIMERPPRNETCRGKDWFGGSWLFEKGNMAPPVPDSQHIVFEEISEWREKAIFPDLDNWDWEKAAEIDQVSQVDREKELYCVMTTAGPFGNLHLLMGFENALCAMMTDPEEVSAYLDVFTDYKCKLIEKFAQYYRPDVLSFHDDWGTQQNTFFSPDLWRLLIKPQIKKVADVCHRNNIYLEMHSCGMVEKLIPEFPELGADAIQCMGINDISAMKKETKDTLAYVVFLKIQQTILDDYEEAEVRKLVRDEITLYRPGEFYAPYLSPSKKWWYPIVLDEIRKNN